MVSVTMRLTILDAILIMGTVVVPAPTLTNVQIVFVTMEEQQEMIHHVNTFFFIVKY